MGEKPVQDWERLARRNEAARQARAEALRILDSVDLDAVIAELRATHDLPRLDYHFEKHGQDLRVATPEAYLARLRAHLNRRDLEFYVIMRKERDLMWYAIHRPSGEVATYHLGRHQLWSFYRSHDPDRMLAVEYGFIAMERTVEGWRVKP